MEPITYIVSWTGGYDAPSYCAFTTKEAAMKQARFWWQEADPEEDVIDVMEVFHMGEAGHGIRRLDQEGNPV